MKLGCVPSRHDPRTFKLTQYLLHAELQPPPPARDWTRAVKSFGMFRNDALSDCTCASMAHALQSQAANAGNTLTITDADVVALYEMTGYNPVDPTTDQGAQLIDVLKLMRGIGMAGNKLGAFVKLDDSPLQLETAVNLTGFAYVGVALPKSAQSQNVWTVTEGADAEPGSWGNHAMSLLGYDRDHAFLVTWGAVKIATLEWLHMYLFESWAAIDQLWLRSDGLTPSGFDVKALQADLLAL